MFFCTLWGEDARIFTEATSSQAKTFRPLGDDEYELEHIRKVWAAKIAPCWEDFEEPFLVHNKIAASNLANHYVHGRKYIGLRCKLCAANFPLACDTKKGVLTRQMDLAASSSLVLRIISTFRHRQGLRTDPFSFPRTQLQPLLHPEVIKYCLNPHAVSKAVHDLYMFAQAEVKRELAEAELAIYLGQDIWLSPNGLDLLGLVAYYTKFDFLTGKYERCSLLTSRFPFFNTRSQSQPSLLFEDQVVQAWTDTHTGGTIARALELVAKKFEIKDKIRGIVSNNASNNQKAMGILGGANYNWPLMDGEPDWICCFAHTVNLIIQAILSPFNQKDKEKKKDKTAFEREDGLKDEALETELLEAHLNPPLKWQKDPEKRYGLLEKLLLVPSNFLVVNDLLTVLAPFEPIIKQMSKAGACSLADVIPLIDEILEHLAKCVAQTLEVKGKRVSFPPALRNACSLGIIVANKYYYNLTTLNRLLVCATFCHHNRRKAYLKLSDWSEEHTNAAVLTLRELLKTYPSMDSNNDLQVVEAGAADDSSIAGKMRTLAAAQAADLRPIVDKIEVFIICIPLRCEEGLDPIEYHLQGLRLLDRKSSFRCMAINLLSAPASSVDVKHSFNQGRNLVSLRCFSLSSTSVTRGMAVACYSCAGLIKPGMLCKGRNPDEPEEPAPQEEAAVAIVVETDEEEQEEEEEEDLPAVYGKRGRTPDSRPTAAQPPPKKKSKVALAKEAATKAAKGKQKAANQD
ncbi:hypothetical protein BCR35DRAFT_314845 [Leucosporidium creatinivorum]|uniref:Uncharacterized protein n=1 Tax=Leucosporidium creatinivorum TaxID=106004 RepID=A0A1Y2ES25_9BASI|nr:hypothetical protein BCR35DRAFT_314845 [Leucosporidium creatinivorum]